MSVLPVPTSSGFYVVGGTMRPDSRSYVVRDADEELYQGLMMNEFCHVLTARQMGKSSLMLRTAARLRQSGIGVAALDLTGIGTNLSPEQWYSGLIVQLGDRLDLEDQLLEFWWANVALGPMQRWINAIRKVVLPLHPGRLAIFIDEIDAVASLDFSTDEFFSGIRECYNLRNEDPDINRLTFCLLGVASPADLIRDTRTTPFNVGRRIELTDFAEAEAQRLAPGLGSGELENRALLRRILYWTNGHPYLTQRLCQATAENGPHEDVRGIDESIERMFFSKQAQEYDDNLIFVRERLLRSDADVTALLNLYARVWQRKKVADDDSQPLVSILRLSGVTRADNGLLRVRNRIYERVFNYDWIKENLPGAELRRQRAAFRRGVIRATAVAAVIVAIMGFLAIVALRQRNLARAQTAVNRQLLYLARIKLANQGYENSNLTRVQELVEQTMPQAGEPDLRGFEWFLFWRYANLASFRIHEPGQIANARFLNGTGTIAISRIDHAMNKESREYFIDLYDRASQKNSASFKVPSGVNFDLALFSPDLKYVATDAPDRSVVLWDVYSQRQVSRFAGSGRAPSCLAFSRNQELLASAFVGGTFKVWDLKSGMQKFERQSNLERPGLAFSPDGRQIAVAMSEESVDILDVNTGNTVRTFSCPKGLLGLIFFSPDSKTIFAGTADGHIYSWNVRTASMLSFAENHLNEVLSFAFSPDGKTLATGSVDRTVKLWDVTAARPVRTIRSHGGYVTSVDWSPDGRYLLSGDSEGVINISDVGGVTEINEAPAAKPISILATAFTARNELMAIGLADDGHLKLSDLSNGRVLTDLGNCPAASSAAFSPDASFVAAACAPRIVVYSVANGQLISTLAVSGEDVYSLSFSPDGSKLVSGDRHGNVFLSDTSSGRQEARLDSGNMYYRAVFSTDGRQIASADQDGKIRIWDVASRTISKTLSGHAGLAKLISFSPDGRLLATAAEDSTVRLWNTASGESQTLNKSNLVQRFAFSPDGTRLVTASLDGAVVLWDVAGLQEVVTLRSTGLQPSSVTFSNDGLILAVSDENGGVRVWQGAKPAG